MVFILFIVIAALFFFLLFLAVDSPDWALRWFGCDPEDAESHCAGFFRSWALLAAFVVVCLAYFVVAIKGVAGNGADGFDKKLKALPPTILWIAAAILAYGWLTANAVLIPVAEPGTFADKDPAFAPKAISITAIQPGLDEWQARDILARNRRVMDLLLAEHAKVVEEIKARQERENAAFQQRFILVGGVLAVVLILFRRELEARHGIGRLLQRRDPNIMDKIFASRRALVLLGLACIISIAIDMHVRTSNLIVHQLGHWIASEVEPTVFGVSLAELQDSPWTFEPYEMHLRTRGGMHRSWLYLHTYVSDVQFISVVLYIMYLLVLHRCAGQMLDVPTSGRRSGDQEAKDESFHLLGGFGRVLFGLIHVALVVFSFAAHVPPDGFRVRLLYGDLTGATAASIRVAPIIVFSIAVGIVFSRAVAAQKRPRPPEPAEAQAGSPAGGGARCTRQPPP